ncbi:MAG: type I-E CRISPR-associated protein Cas7/Cse4/CasC [Methanofollis sp.]|uniref:type I-E CRISPR-associated protein Cas7/Cse4/CasC n=1 Tax=Methanofollis sp. TaxID=2052835 RepID=UPI00260BBA8A|nr:type I-E CRISPR-associated protein Cas7/Cse4/CasC [Methanofollis sp.]MDD4255674.1 type I-E CRISPR-associated protein Cas7/Cse4/CasC [Methanofollis sp.]
MSEFIQLHILASYPPSNLNRDDLGRPKTAMMGGSQRLRISSQSLKRAWRTSDQFEESLHGLIGIRTRSLGEKIYGAMVSGQQLMDVVAGEKSDPVRPPLSEEDALIWSAGIADAYGALESPKEWEKGPQYKQMIHFRPSEIQAIDNLIAVIAGPEESAKDLEIDLGDLKQMGSLISEGKSLTDPQKKKKNNLNKQVRSITLFKKDTAADISMFGRMMADATDYNVEAAVQVAHAITVHEVAVEDDYFTAVDDLNRGEENAGAGHLGESEFAAGLFYLYLCINRDLLVENLGGDETLANDALRALTETAVKVAPTGKQASFASRAYASYLLAERGCQQPRSLSVAYLTPLRDRNLLESAITSLQETRKKMDAVYGTCSDGCCEMNVYAGEGKLEEVLDFVAGHHA